MPYIVKEKREVLDSAIIDLVDSLRQLESDDPDNNFEGNVNYAITKLLILAYGKTSYRDINDIVGALECAKLEFYRRRAASYEDQKAYDNGDVYQEDQTRIRTFVG